MKSNRYYTPKEVAELLMVSTATVRIWSEQGDLKARTTAGGHRRFMVEDVKRFAVQKNLHVDFDDNEKGKHKILIVDDDVDFANFLRSLVEVEFKSVEVEISLDGFQAANKLRDFKPEIVLLDLKMPGLSGFQVCEHIKADPLQQGTRVIAISGDANDEDSKRIIKVGAEACLQKPISTATLLNQIAWHT